MGVMPYERPINTVFRNYAQVLRLRVENNVAFGQNIRGKDSDEVKRRVDRALETMCSILRREFEAGAFGLSTGLILPVPMPPKRKWKSCARLPLNTGARWSST